MFKRTICFLQLNYNSKRFYVNEFSIYFICRLLFKEINLKLYLRELLKYL